MRPLCDRTSSTMVSIASRTVSLAASWDPTLAAGVAVGAGEAAECGLIVLLSAEGGAGLTVGGRGRAREEREGNPPAALRLLSASGAGLHPAGDALPPPWTRRLRAEPCSSRTDPRLRG